MCMQTDLGSDFPSQPPWSAPAGSKKAFVTSAFGNGKLSTWPQANDNGPTTGLAAADAICQSLAKTANLDNYGTFKAWLSDRTSDAKDRIKSPYGPWVRLDGILVANSPADLINGALLAPINETETTVYLAGEASWTATANGSKVASTCNSWASDDSGDSGGYGAIDLASAMWSTWYSGHCDTLLHLYCLEDQ